MQRNGGKAQYFGQNGSQHVNLAPPAKSEYLRHVELIDLKLDLPCRITGQKSKVENQKSQAEKEDDLYNSKAFEPPQTLKEIF